jgi:hypothetical protein
MPVLCGPNSDSKIFYILVPIFPEYVIFNCHPMKMILMKLYCYSPSSKNKITVERGYSNLGCSDTLAIAFNIEWY